TLSDVTLACEGEFYAAHKLVLATCSEYFEKIFEKIEGKHSVIVLKDVKAEELEALLNYMYEGEVNVMQEKLSGLIKAAEYLKVKGLSDSDEAPELFSRRIFKRSKRRVNPASSSRDISLSPAAKRKRKDTDSSNPSPRMTLYEMCSAAISVPPRGGSLQDPYPTIIR
ncbi:UNVERIFIED_CONTAM: hypothetical protein GTU68_033249, partial [Idotea baltica]|nr:hypothetical protein [Idotea baltica]